MRQSLDNVDAKTSEKIGWGKTIVNYMVASQ